MGYVVISSAIALVTTAFAVSSGISWRAAAALYISVGILTLLMLGVRRAWIMRGEIADSFAHSNICQVTPQLEDRLFADVERMMSAPAPDRGMSLVVGADVERVLNYQRQLQGMGLAAMSCYHYPITSDWLDDFQIEDVADSIDLIVLDAVASEAHVISDFVKYLAENHAHLPVVIVVGFPSGVMDMLSGMVNSDLISLVPDSAVAIKMAILDLIGASADGSGSRIGS